MISLSFVSSVELILFDRSRPDILYKCLNLAPVGCTSEEVASKEERDACARGLRLYGKHSTRLVKGDSSNLPSRSNSE